MERETYYDNVRFSADVLREAYGVFLAQVDPEGTAPVYGWHEAELGNDTWDRDSVEEFFEDYRRGTGHASFNMSPRTDWHANIRVFVWGEPGHAFTSVSVDAPLKSQIDAVFEVFDNHARESIVHRPAVFIGHGGSGDWRKLHDCIGDRHGGDIEEYEIGGPAGHGVGDVLEGRQETEGSAILVITAEDVARGHPQELSLDLVREAGVFQGKLGFWSTTLLLEQGVRGFPGMPSIPEIRFPRGNIEESFDDVLAALRR